mgnify:CR=1 FL=1
MVIGSVSAKFYMFGHPRLELPTGEVVPIQSRKGIALGLALVLSPLIAWATGGRYYLARRSDPRPLSPRRVTRSAYRPAWPWPSS